MANKHLKKLSKRLEDYLDRLNGLDLKAVSMSSVSLVDPDEWGEVTGEIRKMSIHIANVNSILTMAQDSDNFLAALSSRRNLVESLGKVIDRVKSEQPGLELIDSYSTALSEQMKVLDLLEETERVRSYPNSKKNYSKWVKKGLVYDNYLPFTQINEKLEEISKYFEG